MNLKNAHKLTIAALLLLVLALWAYRAPTPAITWDTYGYCLYLTGIHQGDLADHSYTAHQPGHQYKDLYLKQTPTHHLVIQYWMGYAVLMAPWYGLGHLLAEPLGYPTTGLSPPYAWALYAGSLLYMLVGLWLLGRVLQRYFAGPVALVTLGLLVVGTNVLFTLQVGLLQVHAPLFLLTVLVLWWVPGWHTQPTPWRSLRLGLLLGLIVLTRATEGLLWLLPLLYGTGGLRMRLAQLWQRRYALAIMAVACAVAVFPQFLYFQYVSGQWYIFSYGDGNGFYWTKPELTNLLLSFRRGWFIYTPLMAVALLGLGLLYRRLPQWLWPAVLYIVLDLWVVSAWHCWWYTGTLSIRALVEAYPVLALGLGSVVAFFWQKKNILRLPAAGLAILLVAYNVWLHHQFYAGIWDRDDINRAYFQHMITRASLVPADRVYLDLTEVPSRPLQAGSLRYARRYVPPATTPPPYPYTQLLAAVPLSTFAGGWAQVAVEVYHTKAWPGPWDNTVLICDQKGPNIAQKWLSIRLEQATQADSWQMLRFPLRLADGAKVQDSLYLYLHTDVPNALQLRQIRVSTLE